MACLQVWDVRSNQLVQHYSAHSGPVTNVAFHPSGDFLLSSSLDTTLKVLPPLLPTLLCSSIKKCLLHNSVDTLQNELEAGTGAEGVEHCWQTLTMFGCMVDVTLC